MVSRYDVDAKYPKLTPTSIQVVFLAWSVLVFVGGCAAQRSVGPNHLEGHERCSTEGRSAELHDKTQTGSSTVQTVSFNESDSGAGHDSLQEPAEPSVATSSLSILEQAALTQSPRLARLRSEYRAAAAHARYVGALPDPKIGVNVFGDPIETAAGSQRANLNLSQMLPWLGRLNAIQQRACLEALAAKAELHAERLRLISGIRVGWYRLYFIDKQIAITNANQKLLNSLVAVANSRIATASATQGDVLLGTLELTQLEERLLQYRRQRQAVEAEVNRMIGRPANVPIQSADELEVGIPDLDAAAIHQIAVSSQPAIQAARLRSASNSPRH